MKNNFEPVILCEDDFKGIVQVSSHCDWNQLCFYIREQQNLSLLPKIGQCLFDKILKYSQGWFLKSNPCQEDEADILKHLLLGGRYQACDGSSKIHFGLKRVLVHWVYGAYVYRHGIVDTPFGVVQKVNNDSIPIDVTILKNLNIEHRNNAEYYWSLTKDFLCSVKDCPELADCNICDCIKDCRCSTCSKKTNTLQRRGSKFSNISKFD